MTASKKDAKKEEERAGLRLIFKGTTYDIFLGDLTGRDVKDFRAQVGRSPVHAFSEAPTTGMDLDVIAGFVWLAKRRRSPKTTYDDILDEINYSNFEVGSPGEVDEDDPEA